MFFDGASNRRGNGVGVLLVDIDGLYVLFAVKLAFSATNKIVECKAYIYGTKATLPTGLNTGFFF